MIIVNIKTYEEAYGERAIIIAKACERVSKKYGIRIVICPQAVDIRLVKSKTKAEIFAQHIDAVPFGKYTGWANAEAMKEAGITGSLINHAEHKMPLEEIKKRIDKCKELGLTSVVCAATTEEGKMILEMQPDFIAVEPPELIGSEISVSTGRPELIRDSVKLLQKGKTKVIVGAGVRTGQDVKKAIEYGAVGILSASEISKSKDPEKSLDIFAAGFGRN